MAPQVVQVLPAGHADADSRMTFEWADSLPSSHFTCKMLSVNVMHTMETFQHHALTCPVLTSACTQREG